MKRIVSVVFPVIWVLLILVTACKKENPSSQISSFNDEITVMVDQAGAAMDNQEVYSDDPSQTIYMQNDGIPSDFLADEACMTENEEGISPEMKFIRDHSFIHCLKGLSLSDTQTVQVKKDLRAYKACTRHAVERAKAIYQDLREKYKIKYQRLWNAYQNGTITKEKFREKVAELKTAFKKELRQLHLKEKLDDALKSCLRQCFKGLHNILTERQWNAFIKCYKQ